ncbi:unnamed protein product [Lota lota]
MMSAGRATFNGRTGESHLPGDGAKVNRMSQGKERAELQTDPLPYVRQAPDRVPEAGPRSYARDLHPWRNHGGAIWRTSRAAGPSTRAGPRPTSALGGQARQRGPLTPELPRTRTGPLSWCSPRPPAPRDQPGAPWGDGRSYFTFSKLQLYLPSPLGETDEQTSDRQEEGLSHTSVEVSLQSRETTEVTLETSSPSNPKVEVTTESSPADTTYEVTVETSASEPPVFQQWGYGGTGPDSPREAQRGRGAPGMQHEPPLGMETSGQRWRGAPGWVGRLGSPGVFLGRPTVLEKTTKTPLWGPQGPQEVKSVFLKNDPRRTSEGSDLRTVPGWSPQSKDGPPLSLRSSGSGFLKLTSEAITEIADGLPGAPARIPYPVGDF